MNNNDIYKLKYIKYKTKYLNLLNQNGGGCEKPEDSNKLQCIKLEISNIFRYLNGNSCESSYCDYLYKTIKRLNELNSLSDNEIKEYIKNNIPMTILTSKQQVCGCTDIFRNLLEYVKK